MLKTVGEGFAEGGWGGVAGNANHGGMGMPKKPRYMANKCLAGMVIFANGARSNWSLRESRE